MTYGNYAPFYRGGYFNPMQTPTMPNMVESQGQFAQPYQSPIQSPAPMSQPTNEMIWVLNENEATSYPVAPNNNVVLWDKSNPTIYVKSVNAQGMPSMRILDFTERNTDNSNSQGNMPKTHVCQCGDKFATKQQIEDLKSKIDDLSEKYEELVRPVIEKTKTTIKKSKGDDE